ncbi:MAG: hypothetical protein ACHQLA_06855 [Ignavibacteriales bacterium]
MIINELSKGISHIEDLPVAEFIKTLNNLHEYSFTEKLDGAQILFGIDENGFYTSRETKGGIRIYNEKDYGISFPSTYMRSSHKLLEEVLPLLREAGLRLGDQVEAEVLYGELPNVVRYSADTNYLIFLRTTEGEVNIDRLKQKLDGQSIPISLLTPYTPDGRFIELREETNNWKFSRAPRIFFDIENLYKALSPDVRKLNSYLKEDSGINGLSNLVLSNVPLNKCPDWCEPQNWKTIKVLVKEKREEINNAIQEQHIPKIKKTLLNHTVRNQNSAFGPLYEDGGWIEGVVLKHRITGKMLKIVDKNVFGTIRENAWKERNILTEAAKSVDGDHSFLAEVYVTMASSLGHPELGTIQAKNYLKKIGTKTDRIISFISEDINFKEVKNYWMWLLEQRENQLQIRLKKYEEEKEPSHAIKERTIQTFASTFEKLFNLQEETLHAKNSEDLVLALVSKHFI